MSWLAKLKRGLSKTAALFSFTTADEASLEALEESLLRSDMGYEAVSEIMAAVRRQKPADGAALQAVVRSVLIDKMEPIAVPLSVDASQKPFVVLMIGVNGAGKTTTVGKLGQYYREQGKQVSFVAADTFRAGAVEQLCRWGERIGCPVYTANTGADAAGLVFDALAKSRQAGDDIIFVDTAGRLQNRTDLMDELQKITRVIRKQDPTAPHAVLLVLDATVGQNALSQVQAFRETAQVTGLIMTKLDGTAKGGILVALANKFGLPVHAIGVGEQADDLRPFTAEAYVDSLTGGCHAD